MAVAAEERRKEATAASFISGVFNEKVSCSFKVTRGGAFSPETQHTGQRRRSEGMNEVGG